MPTKKYLEKQPDLVHRVMGQFGAYYKREVPILFKMYYKNWSKEYYAFHLWIRGNEISCPKDLYLVENEKVIFVFTEENIRQLNNTFGEMSRIVFDFEKEIINK